jgi:uncharacterized protein (TIGR02118 family)
MFKVTFIVYELEGRDREQARAYWRDTHGPIAAKIPGLRRYVQNHAVGSPDGTLPFLGTATIEFDDSAAFAAAAASPEFATTVADVGNFADPDRLTTAFVEDVTVVG